MGGSLVATRRGHVVGLFRRWSKRGRRGRGFDGSRSCPARISPVHRRASDVGAARLCSRGARRCRHRGPVWSPRAQIWDVIFLLVATIGWLTYRSTGRRTWLVAMVPLGAAWAALHGSGIGAYVVSAFALAAVVLIGSLTAGRAGWCSPPSSSRRFSPCSRPFWFGLLSAPPFETIFSPVQARLIDEWAAPELGDVRFIGLRLTLLVAPVLLLIGRRFPDPLIGLLALGWGWLALGSARYLAIAAPFVVASVLPSVDAIRLRVVRHRPAAGQSPRVAALAVLVLVPVFVLVGWARISPASTEAAIAERYPIVATAALVEQACTGRIWNHYDWGGYISYHWRQPVGAYGAADSLGDTRLDAYADQARGDDAFHRHWMMRRSAWRSLRPRANHPDDSRHSRAGRDSPAMRLASSRRDRGLPVSRSRASCAKSNLASNLAVRTKSCRILPTGTSPLV